MHGGRNAVLKLVFDRLNFHPVNLHSISSSINNSDVRMLNNLSVLVSVSSVLLGLLFFGALVEPVFAIHEKHGLLKLDKREARTSATRKRSRQTVPRIDAADKEEDEDHEEDEDKKKKKKKKKAKDEEEDEDKWKNAPPPLAAVGFSLVFLQRIVPSRDFVC